MPKDYICADCNYQTNSWAAICKHTRVQNHTNADWLLGHLIIRGRPEDQPRIDALRAKLGAARDG